MVSQNVSNNEQQAETLIEICMYNGYDCFAVKHPDIKLDNVSEEYFNNIDNYPGYSAIIKKEDGLYTNGIGCGYIVLKEDHPEFNTDMNVVEKKYTAHGGFTYCNSELPFPCSMYKNQEIRVLGFDAAHFESPKVCSMDFLREELEKLADQF